MSVVVSAMSEALGRPIGLGAASHAPAASAPEARTGSRSETRVTGAQSLKIISPPCLPDRELS